MRRKILIYGSIVLVSVILLSCSQRSNKKADVSLGDKLTVHNIKVDLTESRVIWAGTLLGVYTHTGTVKFTEADLGVKKGEVTDGSFVVDLTTMVATDDNFNPEEGSTKERLIGHLSSPDFFDVKNHPTATFIIKSAEGTSATGDLTIRGITNEETVENIKVENLDGKVKLSGDMVFDRKKYNVSWDYPAKDMLLKKEIELKIELIGS
ncbi:MAG: YceI family protein [Bacteroidales bacterium]|nr:YceI family protein [Bacteroidales bacterium]